MKIDTRQIPGDSLILIEEFSPEELDLDTEVIKFLEPVKAKAVVTKSYNSVSVAISLNSLLSIRCGRCLREEKKALDRKIELSYAVDKLNPVIELDLDIREEIILDYPIKTLCNINCKGLCPKCGANLNEGGCNCAIT